MKLPSVLPRPNLPSNLPSHAKWLSGEGAGSWFVLRKNETSGISISRYSPTGKLECEGHFNCDITGFDPTQSFVLGYPSHCAKVTVTQNNVEFRFQTQKP